MKKHQGDTDKVQKIKLDSSIEQVLWTKKSSSPGGKAGLEVLTQFVGNNSEISIQLSDKSGKTFDTIKKKMFGNKFWTQITVPEKANEQLIAEIKLSKHSLSKKSNPLTLLPPIEIKNLKWNSDEVHRGDIVKIIAEVSNVYDGAEAEVQIWEHDSDNAHDFIASIPVIVKNKKIETEWEFQYVDDTDDIPTQEESEIGYQWPKYFFRVECGGKSADSKLLKFKDWIEVEVKNSLGKSLEKLDYTLILPDGEKKNGKLDGEGKLLEKDLPPGKYKIEFEEVEENLLSEEDEEPGSKNLANERIERESIKTESFKIVIKDQDGNAYSNRKYEIRYAQNTISGSTDEDGLIDEQIPININEAKLLVWINKGEEKPSFTTVIQFQQFESAESVEAVQSKLQNLGYYQGKVDGEAGPMTSYAIRLFQRDNQLTETGEINSALAEKLTEKYKSS